MRILALDIANVTGYKSPTASGTWDFTPKRGESGGMSVVRFKAKLKEIIALEEIELVSVELPAGRHKASLISMGKKHGVMEEFCLTNGIEVAVYSISDIKKFATGKGNSGKPAMIQACIDKYKYEPEDDNEADAIHLYHLTMKDLNIDTPKSDKKRKKNKRRRIPTSH